MVYHSAIRPLHIPPFSRDFSPKSQEIKGKQKKSHPSSHKSLKLQDRRIHRHRLIPSHRHFALYPIPSRGSSSQQRSEANHVAPCAISEGRVVALITSFLSCCGSRAPDALLPAVSF
jgi:hypothetical protein